MGKVVERRSVKLNIPEFVQEYHMAYQSGDYEDCNELKEFFYKTYDRMKPHTKLGARAFLQLYLHKNGIDDKDDLGGVFQSLKLKLI